MNAPERPMAAASPAVAPDGAPYVPPHHLAHRHDADLFVAAVRATGGEPPIERLAHEPIAPLLALSGARAGALHLLAARTPAPGLVPGAVAYDLRRGLRTGQAWVWRAHAGGVAALVDVRAHGVSQGELWLVGGEAMLGRLAETGELVALACDQIGAAAALAWRRQARDGCRGFDRATGLVDRGDLARRIASATAAGAAAGPLAVVALAAEEPAREPGPTPQAREARAFADRLAGALRAGDVAAWLGGGAFGALLVGTGGAQALAFVERARAELAVQAGLDVAAGVTELEPGDRDPEEVLWRAEAALSDARWEGGGRTRVLQRLRPTAVRELW